MEHLLVVAGYVNTNEGVRQGWAVVSLQDIFNIY